VRNLPADVLLLDLAMPRASGLETLRLLSAEHVPTKTIVLTAAIGRIETVQAVQLGARGVVLKADASRVLFESIVAVASGHFWLGSQRLPDQERALQKALTDGGQDTGDFDLSPRERENHRALAQGLSNRDIAEQFKLERSHGQAPLNSIFDKCGVSNRLELALFRAAPRPGAAVTATREACFSLLRRQWEERDRQERVSKRELETRPVFQPSVGNPLAHSRAYGRTARRGYLLDPVPRRLLFSRVYPLTQRGRMPGPPTRLSADSID
jgi:DNA-binding NarL/FixJ family response regulator